MNKHARLENFVASLASDSRLPWPSEYQGYFQCFNAGQYYEAHDVLEHLWLALARDHGDYRFYKGLIQLAGAFVHLQKQFVRPEHPKDGRRLRPAVRLFGLATANLAGYGPRHYGLEVDAVVGLAAAHVAEILDGGFAHNPWSPDHRPLLALGAA